MIEEDYVSFETAKLLKEKGFTQEYDIFHSPVYNENDYEDEYEVDRFVVEKRTVKAGTLSTYPAGIQGPKCYCPTIQMAMKWLREEHHLYVWISYNFNHTGLPWYYEIFDIKNRKVVKIGGVECGSYEKTCEIAIEECLKNLI